ncbi:MAG: hypothetical protein WC184_10880 [Acidimicrobiia bacterium]
MKDAELDQIRSRKALNSPARRRAGKLPDKSNTPVAGAFEHLSNRLFLIRESAEYAYMLLEKMLEQTLLPYIGDSSVQRASRLGVLPATRTAEGFAAREDLSARRIMSIEGTRKELGVLYRIEQDWFFLCLTTAGKKTVDGDNEFTSVLVGLLGELRPAELIGGPFSRIARTHENGSRIAEQLKTNRTVVRTLDIPSGMDLNAPGGTEQWQALLNAASWDYRLTLTRLLTGVVFELRNDRYPRAANGLPYGYRKSKSQDGSSEHAVEINPSDRQIVRWIIELAASDKPLQQIADELAKLGLVSRGKRGRALPVNEVADPPTLVRGLFKALPTYLDGKYRFTHEMTLENLDEFHGLPVHRVAPTDNGYIEVDLNFGLPEGGWHDRDLIIQAIHRRLSLSESPGPKPTPTDKEEMKPLASLGRWRDEHHEFFLQSHDPTYTLRRRPLQDAFDSDGQPQGFGHYEGELLGTFRADELHQTIAEGLEQLVVGLPSNQPCPHQKPVSDKQLVDLRSQADTATAAASTARNELVHATNEKARQDFRDLAEQEQDLADQLHEELARLEQPPTKSPLLLAGDEIAAAIAVLRATKEKAPLTLNRALHSLLRNLRIEAAPCEPVANVSFDIEARTTHGALTLGPVKLKVGNQAVGVNSTDPRWKGSHIDRNRRILEIMLLGDGDDADRDAIIRSEKFDSRTFLRRMHIALEDVIPSPEARSALIDCPILSLRQAVIGQMLGQEFDHGLHGELSTGAYRIYNDKQFWWSKGWCPGGMTRRRQLLHFLDQNAIDPDQGLPFAEVAEALGINETTLYGYVAGNNNRATYHRNTTPNYRSVEDVDGWYQAGSRKRNRERRIRVPRCPHCQERKLIQPLKVPEVPGHAICTACNREPTTGWTYPPEYLLDWDGPQSATRRQGKEPNRTGRYEPSRSGRIIVGTDTYPVSLPSLHTPRRK